MVSQGEGFAYFQWHRRMWPKTPPFPGPRPWRLQYWEGLKRGARLRNVSGIHARGARRRLSAGLVRSS